MRGNSREGLMRRRHGGLVRLLLNSSVMRFSNFACLALMVSAACAGCASRSALPATAANAAPASADESQGVEARHMYLFAPGKRPVLIVERDDAQRAPQELSSEPPNVR
jgi:hypothetical protein